ncbi:NifB/NifX family molybdenum-iron cluster-binding protein, partial [Desulfobacterales bacterium HSG17]|nr:NifB/NifX family molybdenum-iron cluster-binding protein [Desulfobacterales bacterium HSG17]
MKVAVSSKGNDINAYVDPRFGRCAYFIIIETDDMRVEAFKNENADLSSSAGIQAASFVASHNVQFVLTGNCGPKAMEVFSSVKIEVFTGLSGTIIEVINKFKNGDYSTNKIDAAD